MFYHSETELTDKILTCCAQGSGFYPHKTTTENEQKNSI